jgi:hypothetical protein
MGSGARDILMAVEAHRLACLRDANVAYADRRPQLVGSAFRTGIRSAPPAVPRSWLGS